MKEYDATFASTGVYPVHIAVVRKMMKRDPATAPVNGDRVPYVLVSSVKREYIKDKGWKGISVSEKAEDPIYVLKNGLIIDADWYVQKQLINPLMRLLRVVLCDDQAQIQDVDGYYEKHPEQTEAYKKLFVGPHMNKRVKPIPKDTSGGTNILYRAFEIVPPCVACGRRAPKDKATGKFGACCGECNRDEARAATTQKLEAAQTRVACVQDTCVKCQKGTPYDEIVCENKACPNWWERISCNKELKDIEDIISRFNI
jgi:DNA polymerase delta subunit 1